jgi:hypothetical protein
MNQELSYGEICQIVGDLYLSRETVARNTERRAEELLKQLQSKIEEQAIEIENLQNGSQSKPV